MTVEEAARPAQTNPHMLEAIAQASERCTIVASEDICDERGNKLWARGQPVSRSLQQRLLERRLRQPLEASLQAEDGVGTARLIESMAPSSPRPMCWPMPSSLTPRPCAASCRSFRCTRWRSCC